MTKKKQVQSKKKTSSMPLLIAVALFAVVVAGAMIFRGSDQPAQPASTAATAPASRTPVEPPPMSREAAAAAISMNAGWPKDLPPLPVIGFPPPRPREVVQAAYQFAVRHPEVLDYVPCFCGCEHSGHKGNTDCFVKSRGSDGRIEWDEHGLT